MANERRRHKRVPVDIPAGVYIKGTPAAIDASLINISMGGAFVSAAVDVPIGAEVLVELRFRGSIVLAGKTLSLEELDAKYPSDEPQSSIVRWKEAEGGPGFGIEFVDLQPEKARFIERLVNYFDLLQKAGVNLGPG